MIWVIGMASLPLIAWLARDWFLIGLITTVPCLLSFAFFKWIPESPRWLLSVGKIKEAAAVIRRIAENNGTSGSLSDKKLESMLKLLVIKQDQSDRKVGVWTLFTRARLARNTTLLTISWVMNSVIYYAITLNASNLSGNQFLNFFILAIIELPAGYLGSVLVDRAGRRWTQVAFFILCTATSFVAGVAITLDAQSLGWSVVSVTTAVISK
jgi:OCT family organic cation transporter-like MFS transporter 4/5